MKIKFPQTGYVLDTLEPSEDFEEQIKKVFSVFTEGTSEKYTFEDKLYFLDRLRVYMHGYPNYVELVEDVITNHVKYDLEEFCELPNKDDFQTIDFMAECARQGFMPFYFDEGKSSSLNDRSQKTILRVIQIVVNWEPEDET